MMDDLVNASLYVAKPQKHGNCFKTLFLLVEQLYIRSCVHFFYFFLNRQNITSLDLVEETKCVSQKGKLHISNLRLILKFKQNLHVSQNKLVQYFSHFYLSTISNFLYYNFFANKSNFSLMSNQDFNFDTVGLRPNSRTILKSFPKQLKFNIS